MHDAQDVFERARAEVDLVSFIEDVVGRTGKKQGRGMAYNYCPLPGCGEGTASSNRFSVRGPKWHCFACGNRGDVSDYAAHHWGKSPFDAAKELLGEGDGERIVVAKPDPSRQLTAQAEQQAIHDAVGRVCQAIRERGLRNERACVRYLTDVRKLPLVVVNEAVDRDILRFLPSDTNLAASWLKEHVGEQLLREAELWKPGKKVPGIVFRPLVALMPRDTSAEFRIIREPKGDEKKALHYGPKKYPWWWQGTRPTTVVTVEGWIDMLSLVAMGSPACILALPGTGTWVQKFDQWFLPLHEKLNAKVISLFDPDVAGIKCGAELAKRLLAAGIPNEIERPPIDGDLNDTLKDFWLPQHQAAA